MDLNKAIIIGRLTRDPEMRSTPQGVNVCSFAVATNHTYTLPSGEKGGQVEYHNVVAWRKLGEIAHQYLKKGSQVYVEGRIQTRSWQGNDGVKKSRTEIILENMIMLGRPTGSERPSESQTDGQAEAQKDEFKDSEKIPTIKQDHALDQEITVEDIPF